MYLYLYLKDNKIEDTGTQVIALSISKLHNLIILELDLSWNTITDVGSR